MSNKIGKTAGFMSGRENGKLAANMKSRCPVCRKVMDKASQQSSREHKVYPFCSSRCKLIDLGKWLDANYSIPTVEEDGKAAKTDSPGKIEND